MDGKYSFLYDFFSHYVTPLVNPFNNGNKIILIKLNHTLSLSYEPLYLVYSPKFLMYSSYVAPQI